MQSYRHIYDERWQEYRDWQDPFPVFPEACPACGAEATAHGDRYHPVSYACGGAYTDKPQIQNHRNVWWGSCPVTRAAVEAEEAAS